MAEGPPKHGSVVLAWITGFVLFVVALLIGLDVISAESIRANPKPVDCGACIIFGAILCYWAYHAQKSEDKNDKGIGFPSVTMVLAIVTAVIAIITLVHTK